MLIQFIIETIEPRLCQKKVAANSNTSMDIGLFSSFFSSVSFIVSYIFQIIHLPHQSSQICRHDTSFLFFNSYLICSEASYLIPREAIFVFSLVCLIRMLEFHYLIGFL
jgi:hypothetical protein